MKEYQTYIFDLDGTLLDTLGDLTASTNHALRSHGMKEHGKEAIRGFVGNGVRLLIERSVPQNTPPEAVEEVLNTFRGYYMQHHLDTTRPYPGIEDLLYRLKQHGKMTAIVSNKFDAATKELARHFFPQTIDVAVGEHEAEGIRKKPAPDTVEEALRLLGAQKEGAVYVGDSDVDIATARNCGLPCISVLWGFRSEDFLRKCGATVCVSTPEQIFPVK